MLRFLDKSVFRFFGLWSQVLFLLASFIAVIVTLISISGFGPIKPASTDMLWLQAINFVLIGVLAIYVSRDFFALTPGPDSIGRGKLGKRFAISFSIAAVAPAILVAFFLGTSLNRGIENWFSDRIKTIVEGSAEIARSNLESLADDIRLDMGIMAIDLNRAVIGYQTEPEIFKQFLLEQASFREFPGALLLNSDGEILLATDESSRRSFQQPGKDMFEGTQSGDVSVRFDNLSAQIEALYRLEDFEDAYLYTMRPINPLLFNSLVRSEQTMVDYRLSEERSRRLQLIFLLGFIQITALILLFFIRYGLHAASQISMPISLLANAADEVRKGHLSVKVQMPVQDNEVSELTASFNSMTDRLREQRDAIDAARQDAIERSRFIEAVLQGVSAGVVRTDEHLNVTLYNPSAGKMFPDLLETGHTSLRHIVPEFAELASEAISSQQEVETTIMLERHGGQSHFTLRVSPTLEVGEGCILTFDDTTRLIGAQRQSAWRDVARRIAHEIRNPLTPIQLSTERLRRRYRKLIDDEDTVFDRCTETILRQVSDIGRMVEEFSSFARMPKPEVKSYDVMKSIRQVVYDRRLSLPDIDVTLFTDIDTLAACGDERLTGQALSNLLKNAGEAVYRRQQAQEGDDIPQKIDINVTANDNYVIIEIEDTGPGFPAENRHQILEPYFTTREQGVGLGLAIVNRIVQDHGGQLTLLDRKDQQTGARVYVQLPLSGPSEETVMSWTLSEERV